MSGAAYSLWKGLAGLSPGRRLVPSEVRHPVRHCPNNFFEIKANCTICICDSNLLHPPKKKLFIHPPPDRPIFCSLVILASSIHSFTPSESCPLSLLSPIHFRNGQRTAAITTASSSLLDHIFLRHRTSPPQPFPRKVPRGPRARALHPPAPPGSQTSSPADSRFHLHPLL